MEPKGPVEFVVLAFPGEHLDTSVVSALAELRKEGAVRVVDSLVVTKSADGDVTSSELAEYEELADVLAGRVEETNLIGAEDARETGELLDPGSCALIVLVEHLWAQRAADAVRGAGGRIAASVRIPPEHLAEAHVAYEKAVAAAAAGNGS
ncbi:DUF6325 family protein [Streptomyces sp. NPDC050095]|uniref:DUF6325 family protein n=1 Tax=unclassified Streptomyces TaxID=2593676 RepID=UPI0034261758